MSMHILRWQGPERTERCEEYLSDILDEWYSEWSIVSSDSIRIRAETSAARSHMTWRRAKNGSSSVFIALPQSAIFELGCHLLGMKDSCDENIVKSVGDEALNNLLSRMLNGEKQAQEAVEEIQQAPSDEAISARHGAVEFVLGGALDNALLFLDAAWCDQFVPVQQPSSVPPLNSRDSALKQTHLSVLARIELGCLSVNESFGWKVGEVLVTDARPDATVQLLCGDRTVATGQLSHFKDLRAVQVITGLGA